MVYLTMVDDAGARDNKTKDMTKEILRWFSKARIPCGLNMTYMEKSQSIVLLLCKEHRRGAVYI